MKIFNKLYGISLLSLLLSVAACTSETEEQLDKPSPEPSGKAERREVLLTLKNKLSVTATKADPIATADENKISSLDIYVFGSETEGGTYTYQERFCYRENSSDIPSGNDVTALDLTAKDANAKETTALLSLKKGLFVKLYCIANQTQLITADGTPFTLFQPLSQSNPGQKDNTVNPGVPKETDFLTYHSPLIDPALATDILVTPLPMTGSYTTPLDLTDFSVSARLQLGFRLTRTVARFDIVNDAATSKFTIQSVSMAKGRKGVSYFPLKVTGTLPTAADDDLITYPARKFEGNDANAGIVTGAFYTYPSPVEDGGYLILSGTYATNKSKDIPVSYKVPFKPADGGNYIEVSQNHRYTVNITKADEYHLDFRLDVADWTDEGTIDDYKPGGNEGETGMEVKVDMTAGATYDPDTRTVTLPIADGSEFKVTSTSSNNFTTNMYYEGGDTQHRWLIMDPAPDFGTKAPLLKSDDDATTTGITFTIKKNPDYKDTHYPIAFIRFTDNMSTKETILIVQPPLTITQQPTVLEAEAESAGTFKFVASVGSDYSITETSDWLELTGTTTGSITGIEQEVGYKATSVNPDENERTAEITVVASGITEKVTIKQEASAFSLSINPSGALGVQANAQGTLTMNGTNGLVYKFTSGFPSWITPTDGSASTAGGSTNGANQQLTYKTNSVNPNAAARSQTVSVMAGNILKSVQISQSGSTFSAAGATSIAVAAKGTATGSVTATDGVAWTITPASHNGISVSPTSGTGSKTLTFTGETNSSTERTGSFTVSVTGANPARSVVVTAKQMSGAFVGNLQVAKTDEGQVNWITANSKCNDSTREGKSDWRLPSHEELKTIYNNKSSLQATGFKAFNSNGYWSSTSLSSGTHLRVNFLDCSIYDGNDTTTGDYVRCVRNVN